MLTARFNTSQLPYFSD